MTNGTTIKRLTPADADLFAGMLDLFEAAFDDHDSYGRARPSRAYVERLLGTGSFIALVAVADGQVVGGLAAYELHKFEQERSEIYIYDLAVLEAHRRRGIATALIQRLQAIAATRSAWVIYVQADTEPADAAAIALYDKLGTREAVLHFDIPVATRRST